MFFPEQRASFSCSVSCEYNSCTSVELEKPLISNPDISNYSREPLKLIVLVIKIIVQTCMSLQTQKSDC